MLRLLPTRCSGCWPRCLAEQACDPGYVAHTIRAEAGGIMSDVEVLSVLRKLRHDSVGVGPLEQAGFPSRGSRMCW